jgi:hypothetical protein
VPYHGNIRGIKIMTPANFARLHNKGYKSKCYNFEECHTGFKRGDRFVRGRSFTAPDKIYCLKCADMRNII